jgi:two-component system CheB/CheR fusion protein
MPVVSTTEPFLLVADLLPEPMLLVHADGTIVAANRGVHERLQLVPAELHGRPLTQIVTTPPEEVAAFLQACAVSDQFVLGSLVVTRQEAAPVACLSEGAVLQRSSEAGPALILLRLLPREDGANAFDKELHNRAERLAETDRRKDEFLAMLAHELRNPLAPIRNALYVLRTAGAQEPAADQARNILERQVHNLTRLVDDLLDVSRITRGKIQLHKEPVELATLVARALETSRAFLAERGHRMTVTLPPQRVFLEADPTRLEQVLTNLLNNAAKFTEPGGSISLTAEVANDPASSGERQRPHEVVLRLRDTGIGIAPEMLPQVFDLFAQADRPLDRSQGGLGIGLTIVRRLVEMHDGSLEAHSDGLGQGSEFVVRLPALPVPPGNGVGEVPVARPTAAPAQRRRVLVVDDNRDSIESLALLLRMQGHEVTTAYDGPSALEKAAAWRPDVVLLDIGLPMMNGYEVAQRLRQQPGLEKTVLAALTGYGQQEDRRRSKAAGFDHHLTKPVDLPVLQAVVASTRSVSS